MECPDWTDQAISFRRCRSFRWEKRWCANRGPEESILSRRYHDHAVAPDDRSVDPGPFSQQQKGMIDVAQSGPWWRSRALNNQVAPHDALISGLRDF